MWLRPGDPPDAGLEPSWCPTVCRFRDDLAADHEGRESATCYANRCGGGFGLSSDEFDRGTLAG
eukprot:gene7644-20673_t